MSDYLNFTFQDTPEFAEVFDEAPLWSSAFGLLLLEHVPLKRNAVVLDLGSGAGFPLLELAERLGNTCKVYGIDPWTNAMARARKKMEAYGIQHVELLETSALKLPFEDNTVDLITSNLGINNFEDRDAVFAECKRVLKLGGTLALTTNRDGHWQEFYAVFESVLADMGETELCEAVRASQRKRGSLQSLTEMFTSQGLTPVKAVEQTLTMRFLDGSALFRHHFVQVGWLESWLGLIPKELRRDVFTTLENRLNALAAREGELRLTVPMVYMEGVKQA